MKSLKKALIPFLMIFIFLAACKGQDSSESTAAPESETESEAAAGEISEKAMDHFLAKVDAGNYVIDSAKHIRISVSSRDQVTFEYVDESFDDYTVMSVDGESFQALLTEDGLKEVSFKGEEQAVDTAKAKLLNYWTAEEVSQGNIYNLFYNTQEDPLRFVSYEDAVKQTLISFAGYGDNALRLMHEVYLVLDAEDPSEVHLQAEMDEDVVARIAYEDIDIKVTFGSAESDPRVDAWMNDPKYPEARTGWNDVDEFIFNSVFLQGYGLKAIPFPAFASYAMINDEENFVANSEVTIRDSHASEQDMQDYISALIADGFTEAKEINGDGTEETCYRRLLREEYACYSSIHLDYDKGVTLRAKKYYDFPHYDTAEEINKAIENMGYLPLPESGDLKVTGATDRANELTESWLYFFDYDMLLYVDTEFADPDAAEAYLKAYGEDLIGAGYHPVYAEGSEEIDYYESENGFASFRYHQEDDDSITLLYKSERFIPAETAEEMVVEAGYPAIDFMDEIECRDLRKFEKAQADQDWKAYFTVSQTFASAEEAESFLGDYEGNLNEAGFDRVNPENVGSRKAIAIYNEEEEMLVGLDYFEEDEGVLVNFEFRAK